MTESSTLPWRFFLASQNALKNVADVRLLLLLLLPRSLLLLLTTSEGAQHLAQCATCRTGVRPCGPGYQLGERARIIQRWHQVLYRLELCHLLQIGLELRVLKGSARPAGRAAD